MTQRTPRGGARPHDAELFALYHLGLGRDGRYRFRNLHQCARELSVDAATLEGWLRAARLDAEAAKRVDFNLSAAHVDAQFVAASHVGAFVAETWRAFVAAREHKPLDHVRLDLDYDAIWGDAGAVEQADP